jgi:hypothetical protein
MELEMVNEAVPDSKTIELLQRKYAAAILAKGDLPPNVMAMHAMIQKVAAELTESEKRSPEIAKELIAIVRKLLPYFHFRVDDVNWRKQWNGRKCELRYNGVVVCLDPADL